MEKDILSSKEIESLLVASDTAGAGDKVIRPYDFRSPELLSKEKFKMLQIIMEEFCVNIQSSFSAQLKISLDAKIASIRQGLFKELQSPANVDTFLAVFNTPPLEGSSVLEVKIPLILYVNQVLLGMDLAGFPESRQLTTVEAETGNFLSQRFLVAFQESFSKLIHFSSNITAIEKNSQLLFIASPEEPVILVTIKFSKGESHTELNFCFPYIVFDSLLPYLDSKKWFSISQRKKDRDIDKLIKNTLDKTKVDLVCELGRADITLRQVMSLSTGDYLRLDKTKDQFIDLRVGGVNKFKVVAGISNRRIAVKIEETVGE